MRPSVLPEIRDGEPIYRQVYRSIRDAILSGDLEPGARLPSTRAFAADAGVSRNRVVLAYEQLLDEGYLSGRHGSGTYVADEIPEEGLRVRPRSTVRIRGRGLRPTLSRYARRVVAGRIAWAADRPNLRWNFLPCRPSFRDVPLATWRRTVARAARRLGRADLDYAFGAGVPALRKEIAKYVRDGRGVECAPEEILVTNGSQQALDLVARVLVDEGDRALVEEPHYPGARAALAAAGAELVSVPVDEEGLQVSRLDELAPRVRVAHVTPSHQFPTGGVLPLARRLALLDWASRAGAVVVEDDYDSEYRFTGRPIESLQGLDRTGHVVYVGTFSKTMFPALRLGYLVAPPELREALFAAKMASDIGCSTFEQTALADFMAAGHYDVTLRRARRHHGARRRALLDAIERELGREVRVLGREAGLHVLLRFPDRPARDSERIIAAAREQGVGVYSSDDFYLGRPPCAELLIGHGSLDEEEIREGIARLGAAVAEKTAGRRERPASRRRFA